jgi:hypothetical protein
MDVKQLVKLLIMNNGACKDDRITSNDCDTCPAYEDCCTHCPQDWRGQCKHIFSSGAVGAAPCHVNKKKTAIEYYLKYIGTADEILEWLL